MLIEYTILKLRPDLTLNDFDIFGDAEMNWEITRWNTELPQPTKEEVEECWLQFSDEIIESAKPKKSENPIILLEQTQTDLIFQLMMNGVI
jgi:hypothetical protein